MARFGLTATVYLALSDFLARYCDRVRAAREVNDPLVAFILPTSDVPFDCFVVAHLPHHLDELLSFYFPNTDGYVVELNIDSAKGLTLTVTDRGVAVLTLWFD